MTNDLAEFYATPLQKPLELLEAAEQMRHHVLKANNIKVEEYERLIEKDARVYLSDERLKEFNNHALQIKKSNQKWSKGKLLFLGIIVVVVLAYFS